MLYDCIDEDRPNECDDFSEQERFIEEGKLLGATHIIFTYKDFVKTKTVDGIIHYDGEGVQGTFVLPTENVEDIENLLLKSTPYTQILKL